MRVMAGAVVVFAGALLYGASALADALAGRERFGPAFGYFVACVLVGFGVFMIVRGWPWDGPPPGQGGRPAGEGGAP